jgi:hypothetical protein
MSNQNYLNQRLAESKTISDKPVKRMASFPGRAIAVTKILLIIATFFLVHTLRPLPISVWDLKVLVGKEWKAVTYNLTSREICEKEKDHYRMLGYKVERFMRYRN